ncbi:hypothetical protein HG530_003484 [Fusarium avenaceum]|nr:hypothetical protein HG530_003484 [Fusarium avenaceum]
MRPSQSPDLPIVHLPAWRQRAAYKGPAALPGGTLETRSINNCHKRFLHEVGDVHGHLLNLGAVELLDLTHHSDVLGGDEVDGNTLSAETTTTTNSVDVVLTVGGEIVIDDQGNLLDIDTTGEKVSGDQDTRRTGSELLHNQVTLTLVHVTVHGGDSEVTSSELVGKPIDLSAGVAEDDGLGDSDGLVQVGKSVKLPLLLLNSNVELLNTLQGKLILLDQDADGVTHELGCDLKNVLGHGGGEKDDLGGLRKELEDVVDLLGETTLRRKVSITECVVDQRLSYRKHLIGLVEDEHLHAVGLEETTLDHVLDTAGGTDNDLRTVLEGLHVITDAGTTNAGVALNVHEVANSDNNLLNLLSKLTGGGKDQSLALLDVGVDLLENRDGESSGLSSTGLSLGNDIVALDDGHDGTLLDGGGTLETVGVD